MKVYEVDLSTTDVAALQPGLKSERKERTEKRKEIVFDLIKKQPDDKEC